MLKQYSIIINNSHFLYKMCDEYCHSSSVIYNRVLYYYKKLWKENGKTPSTKELYDIITKEKVDYSDEESENLYNQFGYFSIANLCFRNAVGVIDHYWKSLERWKINPDIFLGKPKFPKYKDKNKGRNVVFLDCKYNKPTAKAYREDNPVNVSSCFCLLKKTGQISLRGKYKFKLNVPKYLKKKDIRYKLMTIIPINEFNYKIIFTYEEINEIKQLNKNNYSSIDFGINNLITLTTNNCTKEHIIISGKKIKSINQFYNKRISKLKSLLPKNQYSSKKIKSITNKRNNRINHEINLSCKFIINYLVKNNIGNLVIGYNKGWKQSLNLSKKTNQKFVSIPYEKIRNNLIYRSEEFGIKVSVQEESYTSKASFLDLDKIPIYKKENKNEINFSGRRIYRGLYKSKEGKLINADVNGSLNILRKCNDNLFTRESVKVEESKPVMKVMISNEIMTSIL